MYDYRKLYGRIVEKYGTQHNFADKMGMSDHSISKKMCGKSPWKQTDIEKACSLLSIKKEDIGIYFFTLDVQYA